MWYMHSGIQRSITGGSGMVSVASCDLPPHLGHLGLDQPQTGNVNSSAAIT